MNNASQSAQQRFNETYITAREICNELNVTRSAITQACNVGTLPAPFVVKDSQLCLWERATVKPYIDNWKARLCVLRTRVNTQAELTA
jgi:hypothetical protein